MTPSDCNRTEVSTTPAPRDLRRLWFFSLLVFSLLFGLTCQRGVSWQDSGMFQWRVLTGDYVGRLGLALAHPLYIAAGQVLKYIPIANLPGRLNFFSGLGMAVALANLAAVVSILTSRRWIGLLIAAVLAVTHTVWWLSTVAEVYTWSAAALTAELWLLVSLIRRPRWGAMAALGLVNGLGLCIHNFALLPLPIYAIAATALVARRKVPLWSLAVAVAAWLAGAGVYLGFTAHEAVKSGSILAAIHSALFGHYAKDVLNVVHLSKHWTANFALTALNFVSVLTPLAILGWCRMRRRLGGPAAAALAAVTIIEVLFFVRYPVPDQFTFVLPTLVMVAMAAGVGLAVMADASQRWRKAAIAVCGLSIVLQPAGYAAAPALLRAAGIEVNRSRNLPFRDEARYWLVPWKHNEDSAERFAAAALRHAHGTGGLSGAIIPDSTSEHPLLIVRRRNPNLRDVWIQFRGAPLPEYDKNPAAFRSRLAQRPLFVVSPSQSQLSRQLLADTNTVGQPSGQPVLYRLKWKSP